MSTKDLVDDYLSRGPLWLLDKLELSKLRQSIFSIDPHSQELVRLNPLVEAQMLLEHPGSTPALQFARELAQIKQVLLADLRYHQLSNVWDEALYTNWYVEVSRLLPRDLFDEILDVATLRVFASWGEEVATVESFREFIAQETLFREQVKNIPLGLDYERKVMDLLLKVYTTESARVFRANTIVDLLGVVNPNNYPVAKEEVAKSFFFGIRRFKDPVSHQSIGYRDWFSYNMILAATDDRLQNAFRAVWPAPDASTDGALTAWHDVIELSASILATFYAAGLSRDISLDLMPPIIAGLAKEMLTKPLEADTFLRRWLWGVHNYVHSPATSLPSTMARWASRLRDTVERWHVPIGWVNSLANLVNSALIMIHNLLDRLIDLIFSAATDMFIDSYGVLVEYVYLSRSIMSGLLPESRRRPKSVWALLFTSSFARLSPAEKFALSCHKMREPEPHQDYYAWASRRLSDLAHIGAKLDIDPPVPIRGFRLPNNPTVAIPENSLLAPLIDGGVRVEPMATAYVKKLLAQGVKPGIDGMWFATQARIAKSIERYDIDRPVADAHLRNLVIQSAHALADRYPMMYKNAQYLTPQAALNKIKVKFSPGMGFIPRFKSRKTLKEHGILDKMADLAEKYLQDGFHPGTYVHCFVKSQVVDLQKLLDGKNIRTVTASDLMANILQYVTTVEPTRRQPPIDAFVMNAVPRSEGGFRPFYDALKEFGHVIQSDASEFDSKIAPIMSVDGLAELRSIGYDGSLIQPIARSQVYACYVAMRFAPIVDISTGIVFRKTGGNLTGQGNTGVDNRDSFRLMVIAAVAYVTGDAPQNFHKHVLIGNAGDDNAIAFKDKSLVEPVMQAMTNLFGLTMTVESEGWDNLDLVGLKVGQIDPRDIRYYTLNGHPVPKYAIMSKPAALLAKRTEWVSRVAGFRDIAFYMRHIEGIIGSAYLTAHLHGVYEEFADQYIEEISYILSRFFKTVTIQVERGEYGEVVGVLINPNQPRERYKETYQNLLKWLKQHRFPRYADIMRIWLKPQDVQATKMYKDHRKILSWNPSIPYSERLLYGIIRLREVMYTWVPNHVARALPVFEGHDPTYVLRNPDYLIAKFVWLSLYHAGGQKVPSASLFRIALRENPYGSAEDPVGFLSWLANGNNLVNLVNTDLEQLRGQLLLVTFFYWQIEEVFKAARYIPGLAILFNLYAFTMRDINRLYAALNYIYMISTGRSSPIISNMMPPDPYAWVKQLSVILCNCIPGSWVKMLTPGLKHVVRPLPLLVEIWAASDALLGPRPYRELHTLLNVPNIWAEIIYDMRVNILTVSDKQPILVVAPTGTGKSTAFIAGLFETLSFSGTIWLLCPTIVARDNYENNFLHEQMIQKLVQGVPNDKSRRLKILTYGHARLRVLLEAAPEDIIVFDEMHLGEVEMVAMWMATTHLKRIIVTATPHPSRMPTPPLRFTYPGGKRFNTKVQVVNTDFPTLLSQIYDEAPDLLRRALIVCPTIKEVDKIVLTLGRLSLVGHPLSSENPTVAPSGILVATTIVDTAITIQPAPTCLIDLGETLQFTYDFSTPVVITRASVVKTSAATHTQRCGRVGRSGDSIAYVFSGAGSGPDPEPRVTPFNILNDDMVVTPLLQFFQLTLLVTRVTDHPGILGYIDFNPNARNLGANGPSGALALWLFVRSCDYVTGFVAQNEWLDLRLGDSPHEIINILMNGVIAMGFGDPRLGDWKIANDILLSGDIGVRTRRGFYPTTSLAIVKGVIVPCGYPTAQIIPSELTTTALVVAPERHPTIWVDYPSFSHPGVPENLVQYPVGQTRLVPVFNTVEPCYPDAMYVSSNFTVFAMAVAGTFRPDILRNPKAKAFQLYVNAVPPHDLHPDVIIIGTMPEFRPPRLMLSSLPYGLGETLPLPVVAIITACGLHSRDKCVWGVLPVALGNRIKNLIHPGFVTAHDYSWGIVSPNYARGVVHLFASALNQQMAMAVLRAIPRKVYNTPELDPAWLTETDLVVNYDPELNAFLMGIRPMIN